RREIAVRRSAVQLIEDTLKLVATREDDSNADRAKFKQQTEVIEVPIIEWIFVIPLDFEGHIVLVAIHFMGWRFESLIVDDYSSCELLFYPTASAQKVV